MKHTKRTTIPARTVEDVVRIDCDLCKAEIKKANSYDAEEVVVKHVTGDVFPESGETVTVEVDLCPKCFDEKLLPWLRAQGVEPRTVKSGW